MGANVLSNCLGLDGGWSLLSGAVCVQAAIMKWEADGYFAESLGGFYEKGLGGFMMDFARDNMGVLAPHFKKKYGVDLEAEIDAIEKPSYGDYHNLITARLGGYKDGLDYCY